MDIVIGLITLVVVGIPVIVIALVMVTIFKKATPAVVAYAEENRLVEEAARRDRQQVAAENILRKSGRGL